MQCPKCHAMMHTYNRNGVQIEQCSGCRGIFLDYGELEALTRLESQYTSQQYGQVPPPAAPPAPTRPSTEPPHPRRPGAPRSSTAATATATVTARTTVAASAGCCSPPDAARRVRGPVRARAPTGRRTGGRTRRDNAAAPTVETAGASGWCAILGLNQ